MSDESAFLKAIVAEPTEDLHRTVYAELLDENGDHARAELIRLQCKLENGIDWVSGQYAEGKRLEELITRERELIQEMLAPREPGERPGVRELTPEIAAIVAKNPTRITFRRGMIENLNLSRTPITALPPDLHVGGYLGLHHTPITALPTGLHVGGHLNLHHTPITALPPGLHVGGRLDLSYIRLTTDAARSILTMPNLSDRARITGLESAGFPALADEARRQAANSGPGTPPR